MCKKCSFKTKILLLANMYFYDVLELGTVLFSILYSIIVVMFLADSRLASCSSRQELLDFLVAGHIGRA